jgi:hypothetical protein
MPRQVGSFDRGRKRVEIQVERSSRWAVGERASSIPRQLPFSLMVVLPIGEHALDPAVQGGHLQTYPCEHKPAFEYVKRC